MANRTYTDTEKAQALAAFTATGNNASRASKVTGIPRKTIAQWAAGTHGVKSIENLPALRKDAELTLADKFDAVAHSLVDAMPSKIDGASLQQTAVSAGIAVDKAALLRGNPTVITQQTLSDKAKIETAISMMIEECKKEGQIVGRAEAIRLLSAFSPEFKKAELVASP